MSINTKVNVPDVVCFKTFSSRNKAEVAQSALAAAGITSYILGDDAGGMYPPLMAGIRLYGVKKDKKRAESIL